MSNTPVQKAFAYAPEVLRQLQEAGIRSPSIRLFSDGSGSLSLGQGATLKQYTLAINLVNSHRYRRTSTEFEIDFCLGLVLAAEKAE